MSTIAEKLRFVVRIPTGDALDVRELAVHERLSDLFSIRLTVVSDNPDIDFEAAIGQPASFEVLGGASGGERLRRWTGICRELDQLRVEDRGLSTYSLEIVPTLWLATQRRNYRMFQGLSDLDIALAVLSSWGIDPVQQLSTAYKKRKYRVQYGESDYDFLCRVLEDAGIAFSFEERDGTTALVLSDTPQANPPREPKIPFLDTPTSAAIEHVTAVRVRRQVRPGKVTLRDHDYRRQPGYRLVGAAGLGSGVEAELEQYHYTPGAFLFESDKGDPTPAADDRGRYRTDEGEAQAMAKRRLDGSRSEALSCTFDTNALDLAPGMVLSMLGHPHRDLGEGRRLLVVATSLTSTADHDGPHLRHHCEAHRADLPYRPLQATPKPRVMGVESATVVGPAGEEIHTDEFGRVRVHFHWDRESRMDEQSSCWIHVSQSWGGTGYGGVNLPRIGQEVLVDFLGGDPDRPIITGRVYTNLQKVPYSLPASKTQSGWKSNSTNGTGGYNEMMFEDAAGQELLRMQAEKDLHKLVKNDEESSVGRDRTSEVKRNESVSVGKSRTKQVAENEQVTIGQNHRMAVGINRSTEVGTHDVTRVGYMHVVMISPPGESINYDATAITSTDGKIVLDTGKGATVTMDGDQDTIKAAAFYVDADTMHIDADHFIVLADSILLQAGGGASSIRITPDEITISSPLINLNSGGTITIDGALVDVKGTLIKLNS